MSTYTFRRMTIPDRMMKPLLRYIERGELPGEFLQAILSNDLADVFGRADEDNLLLLPAYVAYLFNEAPAACWGSRETVERWVAVRVAALAKAAA